MANIMRARYLRVMIPGALFLSIFFFSGEVALRIIFSGGQTFSSHTGPIVERFERDFVFNRFDGPSRGPQPDNLKLPGVTRLLIQGDSITWGQGIANEKDLYTNQLMDKITRAGFLADMAVLASPGREIDGHLQQLQKWGSAISPDVIIYQWYINDIELDKRSRPRGLSKLWRRLYGNRWLRQNSYLAWFFDYSMAVLIAPDQSYENYIDTNFGAGSANWFNFEKQFQSWAESATKHTKRVKVLLYPHFKLSPGAPPAMSTEIQVIHARMHDLCKKTQVDCIDLTGRLASFPDSAELKVSVYDNHPSARVHTEMTSVLYEELFQTRPILSLQN